MYKRKYEYNNIYHITLFWPNVTSFLQKRILISSKSMLWIRCGSAQKAMKLLPVVCTDTASNEYNCKGAYNSPCWKWGHTLSVALHHTKDTRRTGSQLVQGAEPKSGIIFYLENTEDTLLKFCKITIGTEADVSGFCHISGVTEGRSIEEVVSRENLDWSICRLIPHFKGLCK